MEFLICYLLFSGMFGVVFLAMHEDDYTMSMQDFSFFYGYMILYTKIKLPIIDFIRGNCGKYFLIYAVRNIMSVMAKIIICMPFIMLSPIWMLVYFLSLAFNPVSCYNSWKQCRNDENVNK